MGVSKVIKVISWILLLLLLIGAGSAIVRWAETPDNGENDDGNTDPIAGKFMVSINKLNVLDSAQGFKVATDLPFTATVRYASEEQMEGGYSVVIVPNVIPGKDFDFTLDGEPYSFQGVTDLTNGFVFNYDGDTFTITPKGDSTAILEAVYPGKTVDGVKDSLYTDMYLLIVNSNDGANTIKIAFTVDQPVTGVTLSPEKIEF